MFFSFSLFACGSERPCKIQGSITSEPCCSCAQAASPWPGSALELTTMLPSGPLSAIASFGLARGHILIIGPPAGAGTTR